MRRIQKFAAINLIAALVGAGIPAMAAQDGYDVHNRGGMQHQTADRRGDNQWNNNGNRDSRNNNRVDRDRHDYDRRGDNRGYGEDHGYAYGYAPAPVYQPAPVYVGPAYNDGYYYDRTHNGRTAAIIGGSVAAGALIGAAAGHGQGAVIGAVVGGIAGAVASAAADHHHRY
jgi:hypothetical protein